MLCANDNSFGPGADCRELDFTLAFEQSILSILPDALFISIVAVRIFHIISRPQKLERLGWLMGFKALAAIAAIGSATAIMVVEALREDELLTSYTVPTAALTLVGSVFLAVLVYYEHRRCLVPSTAVICYTSLKIVFNASILRTYVETGIIHDAKPTFIALATSMGTCAMVLAAELVEKRSLFLPEYAAISKESSTSFISRSFFFWLLPLMWRGRSVKLGLGDLIDIPSEYKAKESRKPLEDAMQSSDPRSSTFLLVSTMKAFSLIFFAPVLPRLLILATTFCQPLLVNRMLEYVSNPDSSDNFGWALVGGFICVYGLMTLATALYWEKVYALVVQFRGALVGSIYAKTLRLASHKSRSLGTGVGSTYMSVDVERISEGMEFLHELWASALSIPIAVVILYFQAGWAAFTPLIVIAVLFTITSYCGSYLAKLQAEWSAQTDTRIKLLSSVVNQLLPIKMSAYEPLVERKINGFRENEMKKARSFYTMIGLVGSLSNGGASLCTLVTLATYAGNELKQGRVLGVTEVFTIFVTIQLLHMPLNMIGQVLPNVLAAYASLLRIQGFLLLDEKQPTSTQEEEQSNVIQLDGSFSLDKDMKAILKDIHVKLTPGKLHMCVGPVASGKTTLLSTFLGETCLLSGTWSVPSALRQAYASQDAFIMPGTVKENILFGSLFHQEHYDAVIAACALEPDFERLPFGDETKLGGKGATVSGGQKQRIGLARAVYGAVSAGAEVTLLDDPLSALDAETEAHVFASLFGPRGLLVGKTVVLVTHNVQHLSHADHVLVLDNGSISLQGTFDEIKDSGYDLAHLVAPRKVSTPTLDIDGEGEKKKQGNEQKTGLATKKKDETEDDETAEQYTGGGLAPYKFFFLATGRQRIVVYLCLLVVMAVVRLGTQGFLKEWSESKSTNVVAWIGGYMAFAFGGIIFILLCFLSFTNSVVYHSAAKVHALETKALLNSPTSWWSTLSSGRILNRFSQDIFTIDFTFPLAFLNAASGTLNLMGTLILVFIPTPWLTLSAPPLALIYWFLIKFYLATSKQLQQLEAASKSPLYTTFGTTLSGLESIRAFKSASFFQDQNDRSLDASQGPFHFRFAGIRFLRTILSAVTLFVSVGLAALTVGLRRTTDPAFLGIALSNLSNLSQLLSMLLLSYSMVENGSISVQRIREVCLVLPEEDPGMSAGMSKLTQKESWPSKGSVVFHDVSLKYKAELDPALRGISFKIKPGQKVGICGRTGSGKSSTIQALFRTVHHSLQSGQIYIDGADISLLPLSMVRRSMSLVAQDPFLLHATLRENLDLEGICTDEQIWAALDKVGMKEAVEQLEIKNGKEVEASVKQSSEKATGAETQTKFSEKGKGKQTSSFEKTSSDNADKLAFVVEDSGSFSRGQRQLLCMARVLLRKRRIVILDEASSSMDIKTDEKIRQVIETELHDQTVISVAHRIATIVNFDLILVMDKGQIIECGSPEDLLARQDSQFRRLARSQGLVDQDQTQLKPLPADGEITEAL